MSEARARRPVVRRGALAAVGEPGGRRITIKVGLWLNYLLLLLLCCCCCVYWFVCYAALEVT
jgi:hypothetical protein